MKRKLLLSLFVLMLSCIITLGVVGCDTQACSLTPSNLGTDASPVFTFKEYTMKNSSSTTDSYSDTIEKIIEEGFEKEATYKIEFKNTNDSSQDVTFAAKGDSTWYDEFKRQGGTVTGLNLRKTGMQQITFSYLSYESAPVWVKVESATDNTPTTKVHGSGTGQHAFLDDGSVTGSTAGDGNCDVSGCGKKATE